MVKLSPELLSNYIYILDVVEGRKINNSGQNYIYVISIANITIYDIIELKLWLLMLSKTSAIVQSRPAQF